MTIEKLKQISGLASRFCVLGASFAMPLSTAATVVLFPVAALFGLISGKVKEKYQLVSRNPITWAFMLFYSLFLCGIVYSIGSWADIFFILRKYSRFLLAIFLIPVLAQRELRGYAVNVFLTSIFVLFVCSYLRNYSWFSTEATGIVEIFKSSIEFNFLMSFGAYLSLIKIFSVSRYRLMWVVFFIMITYMVLFRSIGRSGYFVFAGLLGLFCIQKLNWRGVVVAIISVFMLFGAAFIFSSTFKNRINSVFYEVKTYHQDSNTSVGLRITFVKNSLEIIKRHPLLGVGTGGFAKEYAKVSHDPLSYTRNPHNEYLLIGGQFGLLGLIVLMLFFAIPLWYSRFLPELEKYIARGAVMAIMIGSLANSWLCDVTEGYFYAYFLVLAFAAFPLKNYGVGKEKEHCMTIP